MTLRRNDLAQCRRTIAALVNLCDGWAAACSRFETQWELACGERDAWKERAEAAELLLAAVKVDE